MKFDIQDEWIRYLNLQPYGFEIVRSVVWDTERYRGGGFVTKPDTYYTLEFFQRVRNRPREGNMLMPGALYNPCALLVEQIQIKGLTRKLSKDAMICFQVGNKIYFTAPLDLFVRHQKYFEVLPPILIPPLLNFKVSIQWPEQRYNGSDQPKIEVRLIGQMARPIQ